MDNVLNEYVRRAEILNTMWQVAKPRNTWGTINWLQHHLTTLKYPVSPTEEDKAAMREYITHAVPYAAWCAACKQHFKERTTQEPREGEVRALANERVEKALQDRVSMVTLFLDLHNAVNKETGKAELSFDEFIEQFRNLPIVAHNIRAGLQGVVADPNNELGFMSVEVEDVVRIRGAAPPAPTPAPQHASDATVSIPNDVVESEGTASSKGGKQDTLQALLVAMITWTKAHSILIFMTLVSACVMLWLLFGYIGPRYMWAASTMPVSSPGSVVTQTTAPTLPIGAF